MSARPNTRRSLPLSQWPAKDREAWEEAKRPKNPFDQRPCRIDRWAPKTIKRAQSAYGLWLGWLQREGAFDPACAPAERASNASVRAYWKSMVDAGLAGNTIGSDLINLGHVLSAIAPDRDWSWITKAGNRVSAQAKPVRPIPPATPADTLGLGFDLMKAAEEDRHRSALERAVLYRDGLIICFLTYRPVRLANLASMLIGGHLAQDRSAFHVTFEASETKALREISFSWPPELVEQLQRYLDHHRPRLLLAGKGNRRVGFTDALWISRRGAPFDQGAMGATIALRTKEAFGYRLSPHKFRHMAATAVATDTPENITDAAQILSHATLATTEKHYIRARTLDAAKRFQRAIGRK